jgi:hypothetical protein
MLRVLLMIMALCFGLVAQTRGSRDRSYDGTPLLKAKLALEMARNDVLESRFSHAASALREASKSLADYEALSPGPHAETAAFIRQEIDAYAKRIVRDHSDALDHIDLWLGPVNKWASALHE